MNSTSIRRFASQGSLVLLVAASIAGCSDDAATDSPESPDADGGHDAPSSLDAPIDRGPTSDAKRDGGAAAPDTTVEASTDGTTTDAPGSDTSSEADACVPAADAGASPPTVQPQIQPPAGATLVAHFHAEGAQVYTCKNTSGDAGTPDGGPTYAWSPAVPDATLYDGTCVAGHHSAGPTWQSTDGSSVVGARVDQQAAAGSIPWLLLKAVSNAGTGLFGNVTAVQRVDTVGGVAPATGCDAAHENVVQRVDYTATYYFYTGGTWSDGGGDGGADTGPTSCTLQGDAASTEPTVAPALEPPAGATLKSDYHAEGYQIYTCTSAAGDAGTGDAGNTTYAWSPAVPDATLYDGSCLASGHHFAGPTWQSDDGSKVVGARVNGVSVNANAIPWLLLKATSNGGIGDGGDGGDAGTGAFGDVTAIQRVDTVGGLAPASGCAAGHVGEAVHVPYTATYYFYTGGTWTDGG